MQDMTLFQLIPKTVKWEKIQVRISNKAASLLRLQVAVSRGHLGGVISQLAEQHLAPLSKQ
jgi:hypothetical protein